MNEFRHNKALGQNFLTDGNLLRAIAVDAGVLPSDTVVEVGAGAGALTAELARRAGKVIAYEIDPRLEEVLRGTLAEFDNVELVIADILREDFKEILRQAGGEYKLVANLPYYITTPAIFYFLDSPRPPISMTVMVQREVAERMVATNGKEYGALSVGLQADYDVKLGRNVPRKLFRPEPNVDSALVHMTRKAQTVDRIALRRLTRAAFAMRRKTLANNLTAAYGSREACINAIKSIGLSENIRAEEVSVQKFLLLSQILH